MTGGEFSIGRGPGQPMGAARPDEAPVEAALRPRLPQRHLAGGRDQHQRHVCQPRRGAARNPGPHTVVDGDRLILGVYEIEIRLVEEAQPSWRRSAPVADGRRDPFSDPFDDDLFAPSPPRSRAKTRMPTRNLLRIPIRRHLRRTLIRCCRMRKLSSRDQHPPTIVRRFRMRSTCRRQSARRLGSRRFRASTGREAFRAGSRSSPAVPWGGRAGPPDPEVRPPLAANASGPGGGRRPACGFPQRRRHGRCRTARSG